MRLARITLVLCLLVSCATPTQLVVRVDSDRAVFDSLEVRVEVDGEEIANQTFAPFTAGSTFTLTPTQSVASTTRTIMVVGARDDTSWEAQVDAEFKDGERVNVAIFLDVDDPLPDAGPGDATLDTNVDSGEPVDSGAPDVVACDEEPCRVFVPQCGCADGQGCRLSRDEAQCAPAGEKVEGEDCGSSSECVAGTFCTVLGCSRYCRNHADCNGRPGAACVIADEDAVGVCTMGCLLGGSGSDCPSGKTCTIGNTLGGRHVTFCTAVGSLEEGDACGGEEKCGPRLGCYPTSEGGGARCFRHCTSDDECSLGGCGLVEHVNGGLGGTCAVR